MATVNKNFRIKHGLIVEGTSATVGGQNILTEAGGDAYILNLVGGATLVKSVEAGVLSVDSSGKLTIVANTFDSYGSASAAQAAAIAHADALTTYDIEEGTGPNKYFTDQRALDATASAYDAAGAAGAAQTAAENYADGLAVNYDAAGSAAAAQAAAEDYTDTAVANVVGAAPELLDTLNELAAALQDNPDVITDLQDIAAGKQDTLTAGANIEIVGSQIAVKGLDTDDVSEGSNLYFTDFKAQTAVSNVLGTGLNYGDQGSGNVFLVDENYISTRAYAESQAGTAQENAQDYADLRASDAQAAAIETASQDATTKADNAQAAAIAHADGLDTDDIEEGLVNLYFTDARAIAAVGGTATSQNTPDTVVKRDSSGNFAASNVIVENQLVIDGAGSISNDDDTFKIQTEESDFDVFANDISLNAGDDFRVEADDLIRFTSDSGVIHLNATDAYFGDMENPANRIATEGYADTVSNTALTDAEGFATQAVADVLNGSEAFTNLNINDLSKVFASRGTIAQISSNNEVYSYSLYKTGKFLVKFKTDSHTQVSEFLATMDASNNIAVTEYAIVSTNGDLGSISFEVGMGGNIVRLFATTLYENTEVTVTGTLIQ